MENTVSSILKEKMIIIVRGIEREKLIPFAEAVYNGGARIIECTFDSTGATPDHETAEKIKLLADHFGDIPYFFLKAELKYEAEEYPTLADISSTDNFSLLKSSHACSKRILLRYSKGVLPTIPLNTLKK